MSKNLREKISKKVRFSVFKRDNFTCKYCGKRSPDVVLEIDHIIPVVDGGTNDTINLTTACFDCNRGKGKERLELNQVVDKQKEEIDFILEKNAQLEELVRHLQDIQDTVEIEHQIFVKEYARLIHYNVYDCFTDEQYNARRAVLLKGIKKYGIDEIIECLNISYNQYFEKHEEKYFFDMIFKIAKCREQHKKNPNLKNVYLIKAIMEKKFRTKLNYEYTSKIEKLLSLLTFDELRFKICDMSWLTHFDEFYFEKGYGK